MNLLINRLIVALMFSGGLVSGAAAQSLGETYATTQAIFGAAPSKVVADLEGKWLPLSQLAGGIEAAADPGTVSSMMRRFCEKAPLKIEITARSETTTTVTTNKTGTGLVENYDWLEGTELANSAGTDAVVAFLGLEGASAESKASAIAARPSRVALYRAAPDLLVLVPDRGQNSIYGRCP